MDSLNTILNSGTYGENVSRHNDNNSKIKQAITTLENVTIANKGYFDTLASLQAAFPSPKAGNIAYVANVASSTGYYIYNVVSGVWTETTTEAPAVGVEISNYAQHGYSSSPKTLKQVEDEIVQLAGEKISKKYGKNRCNPSEMISGYFINNSGAFVENPSYSITGKIPIFDGETLISNIGALGNVYAAIYDINNTPIFIKSIIGSSDRTLSYIPGAIYVRYTVYSTSTNVQVELGLVPTSFVAYTEYDGVVFGSKNVSINHSSLDKSTYLAIMSNIGITNLFDKTKKTNAIIQNGNVNASESYFITDFIPIPPSFVHNFGRTDLSAFYDKEKKYLSMYSTQVPEEAYFVRMCGYLTNLDNSYFVNSATVPNIIPVYGQYIPQSNVGKWINSSMIEDAAISENKSTFFTFNMLSGMTMNVGKFVNTSQSGALSSNASYTASDYIRVKPGMSYWDNSGTAYFAFYDKNLIFTHGGSAITPNKVPLTGDEYIRVSYYNYDIDTAYFVESELNIGFIEHGKYYLKDKYFSNLINSLPSSSLDIILPRKTYVLKEEENSIYFKGICEKWMPDRFFIAQSGTGWKKKKRCARVVPDTSTIGNLTISLYNYDSMTKVAEKTTTVVQSTKITNNGSLKINVIGDSFSDNGSWYAKANELCPSLTFVGLRKSYDGNLLGEGRGGWKLEDYFTNIKGKANYLSGFSPFMHPADPYRYFGVVEFWRDVIALSTDYQIRGYDDIATSIGFSASGYKSTPAVNDVMYSEANSQYEVWNGTAWTAISEATLQFTFNYQKYLSTWGLETPDIVTVMLGMNDFSGGMSDANFAIWKGRMDDLITSVKAANASVKIAICTNTTEYCGDEDNSGGSVWQIMNNNLWHGKRRVFENFDTVDYENNNVYVVDTGSAFDGTFGFGLNYEKPYSFYTDPTEYWQSVGYVRERERYQLNVPHPTTSGYYQLGVRFAAWIQAIR